MKENCETLPRDWIECIYTEICQVIDSRLQDLFITLILSFEARTVNMGLVGLVILVRMEPCAERKWVWKCFPVGTSARAGKALLVHAVRSMSTNAAPALAWTDIAMTVRSLSHSHPCSAVQRRIWRSNEIAQDDTRISCWLYTALNSKVNANYFRRTFPPLTN